MRYKCLALDDFFFLLLLAVRLLQYHWLHHLLIFLRVTHARLCRRTLIIPQTVLTERRTPSVWLEGNENLFFACSTYGFIHLPFHLRHFLLRLCAMRLRQMYRRF